MDTLTKEKRSWNMSRIGAKNTTPERIVRSFLYQNGFRFRLHVKELPGTPDIVLPKYRTVIEVRGCFWHRHEGCKIAKMPSSNVDFWRKKFNRNEERDRKNKAELEHLGWRIIVIWGCQTFKDKFPPKNLVEFVEQNSTSPTVISNKKHIDGSRAVSLKRDNLLVRLRCNKEKPQQEGRNG